MSTGTQVMTAGAVADDLWQQAQAARNLSLRDLMGGAVLEKVREGIAANFDSASDPDGKAWPPRKHTYPHPILVKTGELKASVTEEGGNGFVIVDDSSLTVGTQVEYAAFHELGTSRLPVRSFMGVQEEKLKELDDIVADGIADAIWGPA